MKLKYIAALIFRVLGAVFILFGLAGALSSVVSSQICDAIVSAAIGFVIGFCLIYFDKKLACLFCKGLDDEPWPNTALEPTAVAPSVLDEPGNPKAGDKPTSTSGGGGSSLDR